MNPCASVPGRPNGYGSGFDDVVVGPVEDVVGGAVTTGMLSGLPPGALPFGPNMSHPAPSAAAAARRMGPPISSTRAQLEVMICSSVPVASVSRLLSTATTWNGRWTWSAIAGRG